jgi:hypothetical protein
MVDAASIAPHLQRLLITSFHVLVAAVTIGRMSSVLAISATMSKQISHLKNLGGDFARYRVNQWARHGEFLEQVAPKIVGCHT